MEIINLDMTPSTVTPNAHAGQYDSARTVRFMLKNGGVPFTLAGTETITAEITRSDNTEVTVNVANTSSNYVDVVFDDTVCTVKGLYACELRIVDGGVDIGSKNFALLVQRDPYDGAGVHVVTVGPADICTFETTLPEPLQNVTVNVVATGGNGTPDNPSPINGYTEANITRCGVNLFDNTFPDIDNTVRYRNIRTGNGTFTMSTNAPIVEGAAILFFLAGNVSSGASTATNGVSNGTSRSVTTTDGYVTVAYRLYGTPPVSPADYDTQLEFGSQATTYHAYNPTTYTVNFGQTIYGGVLDVTRGKVKPCIEYPSYNGETLSGRWLSSEATYIEGTTPPIGSQVVSLDDYGSDIDLTPEVISAVVGTNNVYGDCGQTTVKYLKVEA